MLYTKAAALRLLKGLARIVESVQQLKNCIQVTYQTQWGRCSTFLSRAAFKRNFVEARREAGRSLLSQQTRPNQYQVESHVVTLRRDRIHCDCWDYQRQIQTFKRGCCKHGYHVLNTWLKLSNLSEYLQWQESA